MNKISKESKENKEIEKEQIEKNNEKHISNESIINNNKKKANIGKVSSKSLKSDKSYINNIILSHKSIGKIEHNNIKFRLIMNKENRQSVKKFAFIDSVKSCCFKRNRGSHNFLITFRKHLLSEEHLFKNHIKTVLL